MADDTGTDWAATAKQLAHRATQNAIVRSYGIMPSSRPEDDDLDRAAAVGLRRLAQLDTAIADQEVDLCAICGEVYCSGAGCLHDMLAELPDDYQECGEKIERVQDLVRLGRILSEWRDAAVLGSGERPEGTEPRRPLPPVNPGQRMPGGPTPQP